MIATNCAGYASSPCATSSRGSCCSISGSLSDDLLDGLSDDFSDDVSDDVSDDLPHQGNVLLHIWWVPGGSRSSAPIAVLPRVRETFDQFDANRSGFLDYHELRDALRHYGFAASEADAAAVWQPRLRTTDCASECPLRDLRSPLSDL